jgi:hypothetical protein
MRALVFAAVLAAPALARADSFFEAAGGLSIPVGDSDWTNTAESSPKLGARIGALGDSGVGGMVQADWTPVNLDSSGGSFGGLGSADIAAHRFRVLADIVYQRHVASKVVASARVGAGIDIAHASATITILGSTSSSSDTNVGFGFELGGGIWYDLGGTQIGGELALPIGSHSKNGNNTDGNYHFVYTSYDVDLLLGIRLMGH